MSINCKCKDCDNRTIGCHSNCESYKQFRDEIAKAKQKQDFESMMTEHTVRAMRNFRKRR